MPFFSMNLKRQTHDINISRGDNSNFWMTRRIHNWYVLANRIDLTTWSFEGRYKVILGKTIFIYILYHSSFYIILGWLSLYNCKFFMYKHGWMCWSSSNLVQIWFTSRRSISVPSVTISTPASGRNKPCLTRVLVIQEGVRNFIDHWKTLLKNFRIQSSLLHK